MPYFFENPKNRVKLPKEKDRRLSITDKQKREIKTLYKRGVAIREITRRAGCSRRAAQFLLFPERLEKVKQQAKDREQHKKTYQKVKGKKWSAIMREHRKYKYKILKI